MAMSAGMLFVIGLLPAMPVIPFFTLGGVLGGLAYMNWKTQQAVVDTATAKTQAEAVKARPADEPISKALAIDTIRLELGYGLLPLVQGEGSNKLTDQIKGLRRQLAEDMGYILPAVRIQDNLQLPSSTYVVRIKEIEAGRGEVRAGMLLCMDPAGEPIALPGENTIEPTFGLPAMWIDEQYREEAHFKGYTVVDAPTVVTTHITEIIKDNMQDLLSYTETQKLLDELPADYQKLVADVIPGKTTVGGLQRILQNLVAERVSVRDLPTILEGVSEASSYTKNPMLVTEHVRSRLARQLCDASLNASGVVPLVTLSPNWEQAFAESLVGEGEERQLAMAPSQLQDFITAVRTTYEKFGQIGETPVLLTSPGIRPYVRSVIERFRPQTTVMSQNEIHPKSRIKTLGQV
jgi:flagellar biosynthesis protein FlhA